jgi:hypothetical protein
MARNKADYFISNAIIVMAHSFEGYIMMCFSLLILRTGATAGFRFGLSFFEQASRSISAKDNFSHGS